MSRIRRAVRALLPAGLVLVSVGWAHTALVRSVPARNERLGAPPRVVVLEFNERVDPATSRVTLAGPTGDTLTLAPRRYADSAARALEADVAGLTVPGGWSVEWRVIGADGHPVIGRFEFHVDSIPVPPSVDTVPPAVEPAAGAAGSGDAFSAESPFGVASRFAVLASLVMVIGAAVVALVLVPRIDTGFSGAAASIPERSRLRLGTMVRVSAWVLVVALPARLVMQGAALTGSVETISLADLVVIVRHTAWGTGWAAQAIGLFLLLTAIRGGPGALAVRDGRWRLVAAGGALLAIGASAMGHPAAVDEAPIAAMGLDAIHAIAAGAWVGGLGGLAFAVLPLLSAMPLEHRFSAVRGALKGFSPIALSAATALVVTGVVGAWWQLEGDPSALTGTGYGRWLLVKLAVVAVVAGIGAWHWRVAQPALGSEQSLVTLRSTVRMELLLMVVVLMLTAVLAGTPLGHTRP